MTVTCTAACLILPTTLLPLSDYNVFPTDCNLFYNGNIVSVWLLPEGLVRLPGPLLPELFPNCR